MQLYALVAFANKEADSQLSRNFVESYLRLYFSKKVIDKQLILFDYYINDLFKEAKESEVEYSSVFSVKILQICEDINKELHQRQKLLVLFNLLQFVKHWKPVDIIGIEEEVSVQEIVETVALVFNFSEIEFNNIKYFTYEQIYKVPDKKKILLITDNEFLPITEINKLIRQGLKGQIYVLHIKSTNTYLFRYQGDEKLEMMGKPIFSNHVYLFEKGASVKVKKNQPIYYSEIIAAYIHADDKLKIVFEVQDINYKYPKSNNGIHPFNFSAFSGQMFGIMGGSGTGKSTLLNILNGNIELCSGKIIINGYDFTENKKKFENVIGYIPQDDLLIEELTVFQNLYYNAKLCFGNFNEKKIKKIVTHILVDLDLFEVKNLKVGNPLNKYISGGQRKRLNIALELIREPYILFIDEPTSGLSSNDSEKVIELLKEQSLNGKLLFINIHQPSSEIFKQFDKIIVLDKGGYPVYTGNPIDAIAYFKKMSNMVDSEESECNCCGNINVDLVLEIIEAQDVNEYGQFIEKRKINPTQWYELFKKNIQTQVQFIKEKFEIPQSTYTIPGKTKQFSVYSIRNLLAKLADKQYLIISLLVAPFLALILSLFTKYVFIDDSGKAVYHFINNDNIPSYLFMSITVALFVGLIISAEEIFRDRKILKREEFLNLSWLSYINSKVILLIIVSAIQTISFVLIGNYILEINDMTYSFWLVLFSVSCFANLVGLNISSAFKSIVSIYILIPLILVPQIFFNGVLIKFDKLHYKIASYKYVPVVADLMASRWAYEAMVVIQFKENKYQKHFFDIEFIESEASFSMNYIIPKLKEEVKKCKKLFIDNKINEAEHSLKLIYNELFKFQNKINDYSFTFIDSININDFNEQIADETLKYLKYLKSKSSKLLNQAFEKKDEKYDALVREYGNENVFKLKQENYNNNLSDFVKNTMELSRIIRKNDELIQMYEPIYKQPESKYGRAQYCAPYKMIGNFKIPTLWFNIIVLWLMSLVFYILLRYKVFAKIFKN